MDVSRPRLVVMARWVLPGEEHSDHALAVMRDRQAGAIELVAPDLLPSEIGSAMLRAVRRDRIPAEDALASIRALLAVPVSLYPSGDLVLRSFEIAAAENQRIYDCFYVALAEFLGVDYWTGDERLCNALGRRFPFVRFVADYPATG